jgi:hypothetical protein
MVDHPPQPADDNQVKGESHRHLSWKQAIVGLLALGLLVVLLLTCVFWLPKQLYPSLTETELQDVKSAKNKSDAAKVQELESARLKLQNDARTTLLQGFGALLVLTGATIGASVTLRQVRATREQISETAKASLSQLELSREGQLADRFSTAIGHLGEDQAAVRIGAVHELCLLVMEESDYHWRVVDVLVGFVRDRVPWPPSDGPSAKGRSLSAIVGFVRDRVPRIPLAGPPAEDRSLRARAPDVHAAMEALRERNTDLDPEGSQIVLGAVDLRRADLGGLRLPPLSNLTGIRLDGARLLNADLREVILIQAVFTEANLALADLRDAELYGADFRGARGLEELVATGAKYNDDTKWPPGFDPNSAGLVCVK